jgi:tetratricopeptide (TPR) repeat protein
MSTTGAPTLSAQSPWPGLRPFNEDDRSFFFGRERETAELHALVQRSVVVVVYGQSGLGKTSLLQAGLFHHLRDVSLLPFRLRIDHGDAAPSASTQIKAALTAALDAAGVQGPRPGPDETLWEYFHRHDVDLWGARNRLIRPVIAFDQFEEIFTLGQRSEKAIARVAGLAADLESLLEHRAPDSVRARLEQRPEDGLKFDFQQEGVKFIISLREDFLAQLDTWRVRMPSLLPNRFRLERMTGGQALDVVQRAGGALVDPAVAKEVVDFVSRSQRRAQTGALQARNVEPALLSVVCDELNRRRLNRKQAQITPDLLSGEREGIIQGFYARAFEDVEPRARDWVEDELLTVSGYRDRAAQEDALRLGIRETDLDALVDRRILHREERDGVVWLELTHDLLTDPAYASRTQREQRRLAEDATRREAETNARLRRTSRLAAGFGVLSLAMVVALFFAFRMSRQAADARASAEKERDRAVDAIAVAGAASKSAEESAKMAKAEAARASSSFSTAMGMAEPLGQTLREFVLGDMRLLTPAVLDIVTRTDESYRRLEEQDASAPAQRHGEFLVTAAQALYEVGHLSEGVTRAEQAMALLDAHPPAAGTGRALRAEAMYARGAGYAATGRIAPARRDFTAAIALATAEARASRWATETARVNALSEMGLGDLDRWTLAFPSAEAHYQRVVVFVNGRPLKDADAQEQASMWRAQALMGLAMSAEGTAEQDRRYRRAQTALDEIVTRDPDNLRLLKLSAEIGFLRGRTAADLSLGRLAAKLSADSNTASEHLTQHDPDNLQWRLTWVRAQRAVGYLDQYGRRWASARTRLEDADKAAAALIKADPAWRLARYVHGALLWEIAQAYRGEKKSDRAIALMAQARDEFATGIRRAPGDLEFVRGVPLALGGMAAAHLDQNHYDETIQLSKQALQALAPAEKGAPGDGAVQSNKSHYYDLAGQAWAAKSSWKDAIEAYTNRVAILRTLALRTRLASDENLLAAALIKLGRTYDQSGDASNAIAQYDKAADAVTRALSVDPTDPDTVHQAVLVRTEQIGMLTREQGVPVAFEHAQSASTLVWNALKREAWNHTLQVDLRGINKWLTDLKPIVAAANLAPATVSSMSSRIDAMLQTRQASLLVDWIIRPLMPGPWRNLTDAEFTTARTLVHEAYPKIPVDQIFAVRELPLSFRRTNDRLYEAGVESDTGERGIVAFIDKRAGGDERLTSRFVLIDGTSPPVHQMNSESAPLLDTPARATNYTRFFLGMLHATLGPFAIVEKSEDVLWRADAPDDVRANAGRRMVPIRLTRQSDGSWVTPCTILYGTSLYSAKLTLNSTGGLKIEDDVTLMNNLPVMIEALTDHVKALHDITDLYARELAQDLKQLEAAPTDRKILEDALDMTLKLGRRKDAAPLQQRLVALMLADKDTTKETLVGAYTSLSWYQLFARDFEAARKAAEEGLKLDPADLYLETNRAHALLFLGKTAEAEALYRAHLGKKLSPTSNLIWEAAILQDFEDLEKAGVTHAEMARIRRIMARLVQPLSI